MAVDWIKMRSDLYRDPKVCMIADILLDPRSNLSSYVNQNLQCDMAVTRNVMRNVTVGALVSVWGVLRHRGKRINDDLLIKDCNPCVVDDIADIPGFGFAMTEVGWVVESEEGIVFPNFFDEMNVDPEEKLRANNAERQRKHREKIRNASVTESNVTVTHREEKRREEKYINYADGVFDVSENYIQLWSKSYPQVSIQAELAKAGSWCFTNPSKAPKSAYARFLNGWLSRANGSATTAPAEPSEQQDCEAW